MPTDDYGPILLPLARDAIARAVGERSAAREFDAPWLREHGATFVTLTQHNELRGCIGTLEAHRPLRVDIESNAVAAALHDPRFPALQREELAYTRVEVSLLSPAEPMAATTEADALAQLRPHVDGVILEYGYHRGTFLPQVWEQLPDPKSFLMHLKRKAGLPYDFWAAGVKLSRYTVSKWKEPEREVKTA